MEVRGTRNGSELWPQGTFAGTIDPLNKLRKCLHCSDASLEIQITLSTLHISSSEEKWSQSTPQNVTSVLHSTISQGPLCTGVLRSRPVRFTYQFPTLLKFVVRKFNDHSLIAQGLPSEEKSKAHFLAMEKTLNREFRPLSVFSFQFSISLQNMVYKSSR